MAEETSSHYFGLWKIHTINNKLFFFGARFVTMEHVLVMNRNGWSSNRWTRLNHRQCSQIQPRTAKHPENIQQVSFAITSRAALGKEEDGNKQ